MNVDNGALEFDTYFNNDKLNSTALQAERRIKGLSDTAVNESKKMESSFGGVGTALAAIGGTTAIGMLGKQILDTTAKFEKFGIVLRNTLGQAEGNAALDMIANFAATTPFQLDEVTAAFIKMANQGFVPTQAEMVKLGDLASTTGKSFDMLTEAMLDAQTGEFERLKEFGIKASSNGDKVTFSFREQQTTVDKTNSAIQGYILSLGDLQGIQGSNALISASLTGQISNLGDKLAAMYNEIGTANSGVLYSGLELTSALVDNYEEVGKVILVLVGTYGAYRAAVLLMAAAHQLVNASTTATMYLELNRNLGALTIGHKAAATGIGLQAAAQRVLNAVMAVNPYVLAATALAGVTLAVWALHDSTTAAERSQAALNDRMDEQKTAAEAERSEIEKNISTLKDEISTRTEKQVALKSLQTMYPSIFAGLDTEQIKTLKLAEVLKLVNEELEKKNTLSDKKDLEKINNLISRTDVVSFGERGEAKKILGDKLNWYDGGGTVNKLLIAERDAIIQKQKNEAQARKDAAFAALSNTQKIDALKQQNIELERQGKLLEKSGALGEIPLKEVNKQIVQNKNDIKKYSEPGTSKPETEIQRKERVKKETEANKEYQKAVNEFEKSKLEAQKAAYKAETDAKRAQITDKKDLIAFDLAETLKDIEAKKVIYEAEAKAAKKKPDLTPFATMKTAAETQAGIETNNVDKEQLKKDNADVFEFANKQYEKLKELKEKYTDEITQIDKEYNAEIELLKGDEYAKEREAAKAERDKKVSAITEGLITETDAYKLSVDEKIDLGDRLNAKLLKQIEERVKAEIAAGKLSVEAGKKILDAVETSQVTKVGSSLDGLISSYGKLKKAKDELEKAKKSGDVPAIKEATEAVEKYSSATDISFDKLEKGFSTASFYATQAIGLLNAMSTEEGDAASSAAKSIGAVMDVASATMNGYKQGGVAGAAIALALSVATKIFEAEKAHQEALKKIAKEKAATQKEYNDLLLKQNEYLLNAQEITGSDAYAIAESYIKQYEKYKEALELLNRSNKSTQTNKGNPFDNSESGRRKLNANNRVGGPLGLAGATVKVGTEKTGLFGWGGERDVNASLLSTYPELISAEGKLNKELATSILANQTLNDKSREALETALTYTEEYEAALASLDDYLTSIYGSLGSDMMTAITSNLDSTQNALDSFADSAAKTIEKLMSDIAYSLYMAESFDKLSADVKAVMLSDLTPEEKAAKQVDLLASFYASIGDEVEGANKFLKDSKDAAAAAGFDIYNTSSAKGLSGSIQNVSQETASVISGQMNAMRINQIESITVLRNQLLALNQIANNTSYNVNLVSILRVLETILNNNSLRSQGL